MWREPARPCRDWSLRIYAPLGRNRCARVSNSRYEQQRYRSWSEEFAVRYDDWSAHMTEDVPFYVELAREAKGPLVELAVGNGRVAIPVARETGRPVVGIDFSPAMLREARERAAEAGVVRDLREGDMRGLELDDSAALIYCPFRALLHLPTWTDRRLTFERVAAALQRPPASRTRRLERNGRRDAGHDAAEGLAGRGEAEMTHDETGDDRGYGDRPRGRRPRRPT